MIHEKISQYITYLMNQEKTIQIFFIFEKIVK